MIKENSGKCCIRNSRILMSNKDHETIQLTSDNGNYLMTIYQVFPGICFIYSEAHVQSIDFEDRPATLDQIIEISYCREGRLEFQVQDKFCYLSPGDLAIVRSSAISSSDYFPLRHYHGVTLRIDLEAAPTCLSCFLDDIAVQPLAIAKKFCSEKNVFVARAKPPFTHIFSELYSVSPSIQRGYFKIKTLELLLFLSALDETGDEFEGRAYTGAQMRLAKKVSRYLSEHMDEHVTLEQLAAHFHVSSASIKNSFKGVYGVPVGSYIRTQKMESAAYMLEYTDKTVLEIAGEHGYENGSKFASAFRGEKGMNPAEYRIVKNGLANSRLEP